MCLAEFAIAPPKIESPEMRDTIQILPEAGREYVQIDGIYVKVSDRLRTLVSLLADGCSETELRREVDAIKPGHTYEAHQLRDLIDQLFLPHGLGIDECSLNSCATWRLCTTVHRKGVSGLESALRCRVTIVPEILANRVAQCLKFLYTPVGAFLAMSLCILIIVQYLSHFGFTSLSLSVLFKSIPEASVLSVVITIAAIVLASLSHEVGHCTAVAAYGSRVRRIGVGIYWLSPALFSDVSAAWTLTRWQRVAVDCGGIYFQALVCSAFALATILVRSTAMQLGFRIAIVANIVAVVCSLNPIMKCDGYWILSDAMCIPNLRRQSERAIRDLVRSIINRRCPEPPSEIQHRRFLICYGVLSLLFSAIMFFLFATVIRRNAAEAFFFPKEVWNLFANNLGTGHLRSGCARLALDFLKVVPVACAPIALLTAASALMGFVRRVSSKAE